MKTTKADFSRFKKETEYWIDFFGLKDWEIYFRHEKNEKARAETWIYDNDRIATIELSTYFATRPQSGEIELCAFHEVVEVLLSPLGGRLNQFLNENITSREIHIIIKRLENAIFWPNWKGRK